MNPKLYTAKRAFSKKKKERTKKDSLFLKNQLLSAGEKKLLEGHLFEALELFHQADSLGGFTEADLYYRQGIALFDYGSEKGREQTLLLANKKFKIAYTLDARSKDILHAWANTLALIGERKENPQFLFNAKKKYEEALLLEKPSMELRWDYGVLLYQIGLHSEEPCDLKQALSIFELLSLEMNPSLPSEFWLDYGLIHLELHKKTKQVPSLELALTYFKTALKLWECDPSSSEEIAEGWALSAEALQSLYEIKGDISLFIETDRAFSAAVQSNPKEDSLWLEWIDFLCKTGLATQDPHKLRKAIEKCIVAYPQLSTSHTGDLLSIWGEALSYLGMLTENFDLICQGEEKILEALEIDDHIPEYWYRLGKCLSMFGIYFQHLDYYYQAIEKFQEGLSLDRSADFLWHAMGNAYATLGGMEGDFDLLEKALKFLIKALELRSTPTLQIDYANCLFKIGELSYESGWIEEAMTHFAIVFEQQPGALYTRFDWVFSYGQALSLYGDITDSQTHYEQALHLFFHLLILGEETQDNPYHLHQKIGQIFCHLGDMTSRLSDFESALSHLQVALKQDPENDAIALDYGIALIHLALYHRSLFYPGGEEVFLLYKEAEETFFLSLKLGNTHAYYQLACLYSIQQEHEKTFYFLDKAASLEALPPFEEILYDEWLESFRMTEEFKIFLAKWPYLTRHRSESDLDFPFFDSDLD